MLHPRVPKNMLNNPTLPKPEGCPPIVVPINIDPDAPVGQAVNMLRTKTLEEAKAIVECSFGNFLSGDVQRRQAAAVAKQQAAVSRLAAEAEAAGGGDDAPQGVSAQDWADCQKLEERCVCTPPGVGISTGYYNSKRDFNRS